MTPVQVTPAPLDRQDEDAARDLRRHVHPLTGDAGDHDPLLDLIGDSSLVLLGEATHGTHDFYRERIRITRRLVEEKGFTAVAVEADWPDAYRVNRYGRGAREDADAEEALGGFRRFPTWMWRNAEVLDFVGWLRTHNEERGPGEAVGFYGLDLYSLYTSIAEVIDYLERVDPAAAERARRRYGCLEHFGGDSQEYGRAVILGVSDSCRQEVIAQLVDLQQASVGYLRRDGLAAEDDLFYAEQNARLVTRAEEYYRSMFSGAASSWNLRDTHMADTLDRLMTHLGRHGDRPKIVVWEHNSHVGDARMTEMSLRGELNLGQLARQRHEGVTLIGFTTDSGTVTAASAWDAPAERKQVRPALPGSHESVLHHVGKPRFMLDLRQPETAAILGHPRLERAIGVIYRPETERASHYFKARLAHQFDAVIHLDESRAVEPLERTGGWELGEPPETYPTAL